MMLRGALPCAIVHVASPALRPPSSISMDPAGAYPPSAHGMRNELSDRAEVPSQARSILSCFSDQGSERAL